MTYWRPEDHCAYCGSTSHGSFYHEYVLTPSEAWQRKCQRAYQRYGRTCQACRVRAAVQVHHMTYKRLGREKLEDLRVLCDTCHRCMHRIKGDPGGWGLDQRRLAI